MSSFATFRASLVPNNTYYRVCVSIVLVIVLLLVIEVIEVYLTFTQMVIFSMITLGKFSFVPLLWNDCCSIDFLNILILP